MRRYSILLLLLLTTGIAGAESALEHRVLREGVAIDLTLEPLDGSGVLREGSDVAVRLAITETHTGTPMTTLYPAGWMDRLPVGVEDDPQACKKKVEGFLGGSLLSQAELDLNVYYVLALNDDASISVVDPLFGFGGSKLLTLVVLESPGEDWVLDRAQERLYVSMPRSGKVAVVDTASWKVIRNVEVGPTPTRLLLQSDERFLWVAYEGDGESLSGVSVIDVEERAETKRLETGRGAHLLAFDEGERRLFVSNEGDATVTVIDAARQRLAGEAEIGGRPVGLDYSPIGRTAWAATAEGALVAIDEGGGVAARDEVEPGLVDLAFTPGGRWGFAVNPATDELHVVDAAARRVVQTGIMEAGPVSVGFSDTLAYVSHRESDLLLMVPLDQVGEEGEPIPVIDTPGGRHPAGLTEMPSSAPTLVQAPGGSAVLIANPLDKAIYFYKEGMAAPMGHFQNYGRQPRAVEVVDRSLRENEPGIYQTTARMRRPGLYEVAVFVDSPRVVHCFPVEVLPDLEAERRAEVEKGVAVDLRADARQVAVGEPIKLEVEVRDPATGEPFTGLSDVDVLAMLSPGIWQQREWAKELGDGRYEVELVPPRQGVYYVFVAIPSRKLGSNQGPSLVVEAVAEEI